MSETEVALLTDAILSFVPRPLGLTVGECHCFCLSSSPCLTFAVSPFRGVTLQGAFQTFLRALGRLSQQETLSG